VAEGKVDGAKPGMFLNGVTEKLYDGDVFLIPCLTKHNYVERTPESAGGKFVGEHALDSDVVRESLPKGTPQPKPIRTPTSGHHCGRSSGRNRNLNRRK
jgi:hypothetical protein